MTITCKHCCRAVSVTLSERTIVDGSLAVVVVRMTVVIFFVLTLECVSH
jgi:hypothetical protein